MIGEIKRRISLHNKRVQWRKRNTHNETSLMNDFDMDCVSVGRYTYGGLYVYSFNKGSNLRIGDFCSIAGDVAFVLNADHRTDTISTFPFKAMFLGEDEGASKGDIVVDDDVWFGFRSTILSGVHIGQGAVIAAGAVVTKDVPPYAIVGGVPAKVIKYRFDPNVISELMNINYKKINDHMISQIIDDLYDPLLDMEQIRKLNLNKSDKE